MKHRGQMRLFMGDMFYCRWWIYGGHLKLLLKLVLLRGVGKIVLGQNQHNSHHRYSNVGGMRERKRDRERVSWSAIIAYMSNHLFIHKLHRFPMNIELPDFVCMSFNLPPTFYLSLSLSPSLPWVRNIHV